MPSSICGSREGPIWHQFYLTNLAPISTGPIWHLRLLFEFLNPSLRSLHLFDGSVQLPFGTIPPLADPAENREQADDGQQVNCNHFLICFVVCGPQPSPRAASISDGITESADPVLFAWLSFSICGRSPGPPAPLLSRFQAIAGTLQFFRLGVAPISQFFS